MKLTHFRHATHLLAYAGFSLLVDPVFGEPHTQRAIPCAPDPRMNPLVPLPIPADALPHHDAVLVTHLHGDHFDEAASVLLPKNRPVFCQPHDAASLRKKGFSYVRTVKKTEPLQISGRFADDAKDTAGGQATVLRTGGTHGTGLSAIALNPVSGYVLKAEGEPTVYLPGDTVWCREVERTLKAHRPDVIVAFGGAALYAGDTITMGIPDFERMLAAAPESRLAVLHLEAWNHCGLTRAQVRAWRDAAGLCGRVLIPEDGETLAF